MSTLFSIIDLTSLSQLIIMATDISSIKPVVGKVLVSCLTLVLGKIVILPPCSCCP
jgi:hypothetical protein